MTPDTQVETELRIPRWFEEGGARPDWITPQNADLQYALLIEDLFVNGQRVDNERTGTGTTKVFGRQMRFDLSAGKIPILTTKKVRVEQVVDELLWFRDGSTNIRPLLENKVRIWSDWPFKKWLLQNGVKEEEIDTNSTDWKRGKREFEQRILQDEDFAHDFGDLGHVYGFQWRHWPIPGGGERDQLREIIERIKINPFDRSLIVTSWHPGETDRDKVALPPCHMLYQFNVNPNGTIDLRWDQRSTDVFLGLPFNILSYGLLLYMVAQSVGLQPNELILNSGDTHLYNNHITQAREQQSRIPMHQPTISLNPNKNDIDDFDRNDFVFDYTSHPFISAPISV